MTLLMLGTTTITELRLMMRRPAFWIYTGITVLVSVYVGLLPVGSGNWLERLTRVINNITFVQFPLLAWLAGSTITRNSPPARDWLWATGIELPSLVIGQLLGMFCGLLASLALAIGCTGFAMALQGFLAWQALVMFFFFALLLIGPVMVVELAVVTSLGLIVRRMSVIAALVATFYALLILGVLMPYATLGTPLNHTLLTLHLDPVAGLGAERPLVASLMGLYFFFAIGVLSLTLWLIRFLDHRTGWPSSHMLMKLLALVGLVGGILASIEYRTAVLKSIVPPPVTDQMDTWSVQTARHEAHLAGSSMEVIAELQLVNTGQLPQTSIVLALNPGLRVTKTRINRALADAQPEGEFVRLVPANSPIQPREMVTVEISYQGMPHLFREDYSRANSMRGFEFTTFVQPIRAYVSDGIVLLERDGDWRIWPLMSTLHVAPESAITITLPAAFSVLSSGESRHTTPTSTTFAWSSLPPQLLVVAGPYAKRTTNYGDVYIAPMGDNGDIDRLTKTLLLQTRLENWLLRKPSGESYQAVVLPYSMEVVQGGSLIGIPVISGSTYSELQRHWGSQRATEILAHTLAQSWFDEKIAWPRGSLNTTGQSRSQYTECNFTDGQPNCLTGNFGVNTPQAPQGRLTQPAIASPLLYAWSRITARHVATDLIDPALMEEERRWWVDLATRSGSAPTPESMNALIHLTQQGLLPAGTWDNDALRVAQLVDRVNRLYQELGAEGFARVVEDLSIRYPPAGSIFSEDEFARLLRQHNIE